MRQSSRLILNTGVTFARLVCTVGLGLMVTRFALRELGDAGYGVLMVLGGSSALLLLFADAAAMSIQRHIAFDLGAEETLDVRRTASTAVVLFVVLAALIMITAALIAGPLVRVLEVPPDLTPLAAGAFFWLAAQYASNMLSTPSRAFLLASQSMWALSIVELVDAVARFAAVIALMYIDTDAKLLVLARLFFLATLPGLVLATSITWAAFPASRPSLAVVTWSSARRIVGFGSWALIGTLSGRLRMQGSQILLNVAVGPVANSAYGIATQAAGYQTRIGFAIRRAAFPAVVSQRGAANHSMAQNLAIATSKFLALSSAFIALPILIDPVSFTQLWLSEVPPHTVVLLTLVIIATWVIRLAEGHSMAIHATGNIRGLTIAVLALEATSLGGAVVAFYVFGAPVWALPAIAIVGGTCIVLVRVHGFRKLSGVEPSRWYRGVLAPTLAVIVPAIGVGLLPRALMDPGLARLLMVAGASGTALLLGSWFLGCTPEERGHFKRIASAAWSRFGSTSHRGGGMANAKPR